MAREIEGEGYGVGMSFLRNRVLRRFSILGRLADLALVGGMALRLAKRQGWIESAQIDQFGSDPDEEDRLVGLAEIALTTVALVRLLRRTKH